MPAPAIVSSAVGDTPALSKRYPISVLTPLINLLFNTPAISLIFLLKGINSNKIDHFSGLLISGDKYKAVDIPSLVSSSSAHTSWYADSSS